MSICRSRVARACALVAVVLSLGQIQAARHLSYNPQDDPNWPNRKPTDNNHFGDWEVGRSTFAYNEDGMDLNQAACRFGTIDPSKGLGLQVAAISDANPTYGGSCGRCYEIKCAPMIFKDGLNNTVDRTNACFNDKTIVVRIVDTCPCNYPKNPTSNKRWCCGDMTHFDTSYWAISKLADPKYGVVGINYRQVPCDFAPTNNAGPVGLPYNYTEGTSGAIGAGMDTKDPSSDPPATISESNMATTRNGSITLSILGNSSSASNATAPSNVTASSPPSYSSSYSPYSSPSSPPSLAANTTTSSNATSPSTSANGTSAEAPPSGGVTPIYKDGGFQASWVDASWSTSVSHNSSEGLNNGAGFCANPVYNNGGLALHGAAGQFNSMLSLQFYVKGIGSSSVPNIVVKIASDKGACNAVALSSLQNSGIVDGWSKYDVFLGNFDRSGPSSQQQVQAFAPAFDGCGGIPAASLTRVEFDNYSGTNQQFCVDQIYLLG